MLSGQPTTGAETVYVIRAGAHAAPTLYRQRIAGGNPCGRAAGVQWHGRWLLYTTSGGTLVVLDSTGRHHAIELSPLVRNLPGHSNGISAYWTGQAPAL